MHQLLLFLHLLLLLFLFLPNATFSAPAGSCNRRCGSTTVPYPFGFSGGNGGCPILLAGNASASTALLPRSTAWGEPYPVLSFNATASTFLVSLAPSCDHAIAEARAALADASYGVTSRTGLFLRGGYGDGPTVATGLNSNASSGCNVPSGVMSAILRTVQCGGGGNGNDSSSASWVCVGSAAAASGKDQFLRWDEVAAAGCQDALTSAVYADTAQGVPSIEFGIAEMGWWLNRSCNSTAGGSGDRQCARNATCHDAEMPSGAWGHRCACANGIDGEPNRWNIGFFFHWISWADYIEFIGLTLDLD